MDTLIIINNRNRLTCLRALLKWLWDAGYNNIMITDNASDYPPLLEYYSNIEKYVKIIRLKHNRCSRGLWQWPDAHEYVKGPFVLTDPDIIPDEKCPTDVVPFLKEVSDSIPNCNKTALSLRIGDIPNCYLAAPEVRKWESQFWKDKYSKVRGVQVFRAAVGTTFAYYPVFKKFSLAGFRTGFPYVARHADWYINSANPSEERIYYEEHSVREPWHNWGITGCYSDAVKKFCGE